MPRRARTSTTTAPLRVGIHDRLPSARDVWSVKVAVIRRERMQTTSAVSSQPSFQRCHASRPVPPGPAITSHWWRTRGTLHVVEVGEAEHVTGLVDHDLARPGSPRPAANQTHARSSAPSTRRGSWSMTVDASVPEGCEVIRYSASTPVKSTCGSAAASASSTAPAKLSRSYSARVRGMRSQRRSGSTAIASRPSTPSGTSRGRTGRRRRRAHRARPSPGGRRTRRTASRSSARRSTEASWRRSAPPRRRTRGPAARTPMLRLPVATLRARRPRRAPPPRSDRAYRCRRPRFRPVGAWSRAAAVRRRARWTRSRT